MGENKSGLTMADVARFVARLNRRLAQEAEGLCQGMWNPAFCSSDGTHQARDLIDELQAELDHLKARVEASHDS